MPAETTKGKLKKDRKRVQQPPSEATGTDAKYLDPKWYVKGTTVVDWLGVVNRDNGPYSPTYTVFDRALFLNKLDLLENETGCVGARPKAPAVRKLRT